MPANWIRFVKQLQLLAMSIVISKWQPNITSVNHIRALISYAICVKMMHTLKMLLLRAIQYTTDG